MDAPSIGWIEREAIAAGYSWVLGVDEVGRGPLAGPVTTAAALIALPELAWCQGLDDSKKLSARKREGFIERIESQALSVARYHVPVEDVDRMNVLAASLHGMAHCAIEVLGRANIAPDKVLVLVDGKQTLPGWVGPQRAVVKGDASSFAIAAASILAKVSRDALMAEYDEIHPGYGFAKHAGYGTRAHLEALERLGVCPIHRKSFAPVRKILERKR